MSTILIVDDDETVIEVLDALVRFLGYDSHSTLYPAQTLPILEKNSIDLILLDVYMPVLDGVTLLQQIMSHPVYKKIPVIMLTGDEDEKLLERCFESGATDFITKPIKKTVLKSRIKSALSTKEYIRQLGNLNENLEKKVEERTLELHKSEKRYRAIAEDMPVLIYRSLPDGEITYVNEAYCQYFQKTQEELVGHSFLQLIPEAERETVMANIATMTVDSPTQLQEHRVFAPDGEIRWQRWTNRGLFDDYGKVVAYQSIGEDITERKEAEEMRQKHNKVLEQKNLALREVLSLIEHEKKEIKDNIMASAENLLLPIIEKIRLKGESRKYANLLKKSLKELTSSFGTKLNSKEAKLTSREIEICNMIKNGLGSKEIAELLSISDRTIEKHRNNIRKKLGIRKKNIALASFLKTL